MRKEPDYNDLVLKWPAPFRDGLKFTNHDLAILDIIIYGPTDIAAKDFEEMKKFGYVFDGFCTVQDEDDGYLMTLVAFREYQAPPLEYDGESDRQVL